MEKLLSVETLAALTETSPSLWRKLAARRLIRVVKVGRALRVREADALRFLAERERPARESGP